MQVNFLRDEWFPVYIEDERAAALGIGKLLDVPEELLEKYRKAYENFVETNYQIGKLWYEQIGD